MKVFIGTVDISSRIRDIVREFRRRGIETLSAKRTRHHRHISDVDIVLSDSYSYSFRGVRPRRLQRSLKILGQKTAGVQAKLLRRVTQECDLAIFLWSSILDDRTDYRILSEAGKKIITCFVGSDVRSGVAANAEFSKHGFSAPFERESIDDFARKLEYVRHAESLSTAIFSRPEQAQLQRRPYSRFVPFITCEDFKPKLQQRASPLILHPCSDNPVKGVKFVQRAIEELKTEGLSFEYQRLSGMTQRDVRLAMRDADIIIDQLFLPGGGKVSVEGMASGAVVLTRMEYNNYPALYPVRPPIVDVNPDNIRDELRRVVKDLSFRVELATAGPQFVKHHANIRSFVDSIIAVTEKGDASTAHDYTPMFCSEGLHLLPAAQRRMIMQT